MTKRFLCLFLAVLCVLSLTACSKTDDTAATKPSADGGKPTTVPTVPTTEPAPTEPVAPEFDPYTNKTWAEDGVLKILTIGNSFSRDAMAYVYDIAHAAGVEKVYLGDLYIGSCTVAKHLKNAKEDNASYSYFTNEADKWVEHTKHKMSDAIKSQNWDFISIQQNSENSGLPDKYSDLEELLNIVESQCTNPKVEFVWHMTWAYQNDYDGKGFVHYQVDQETMYNAIIGAVKQKVFPLKKITRVIPNGTAVQNIRTSYWGDTITRDGLHMSLPYGRILTGITIVAATVGIDFDKIDLSDVHSKLADDEEKFIQVALESVKNAMENPYQVTQSKLTK